MSQFGRFLLAGSATVGLYVGGVWFGTDLMSWPPRQVNIFFYVLATTISFCLAYLWIFNSKANVNNAMTRYLILQALGVVFNYLWLEAGLRFTSLYPWLIALSYFSIWAVLSFTAQRLYVFK